MHVPHCWSSGPQLSLKIFNLPTGMKVYTVYCTCWIFSEINIAQFWGHNYKTVMCMYAILYLALMVANTNLFLSFCQDFTFGVIGGI